MSEELLRQGSGGDGDGAYFTGQLLVAMPAMTDPRFAKTVIYMCVHNPNGAMGLVINKHVESIGFPQLLEQLNIEVSGLLGDHHVFYGGPVESGRGFVLHSTDYVQDGTVQVDDGFALTATIDVLKAIACNEGPREAILALGYAGWGAGQLDGEVQANAWLNVPADEALVFDQEIDTKWERAMAKIGVDPVLLSGDAGRA
ncbi:MAG: YqgE/AlgH family protein [Alphaproteobacteria bacterium]|nr:YqgE/AlgH family protein [Alphaproteobacteria bacterium]